MKFIMRLKTLIAKPQLMIRLTIGLITLIQTFSIQKYIPFNKEVVFLTAMEHLSKVGEIMKSSIILAMLKMLLKTIMHKLIPLKMHL